MHWWARDTEVGLWMILQTEEGERFERERNIAGTEV